jgi:hypothetical protein
MVIVTKDKYIHYVSLCYLGTAHDYGLLKSEFSPVLYGLKTIKYE